MNNLNFEPLFDTGWGTCGPVKFEEPPLDEGGNSSSIAPLVLIIPQYFNKKKYFFSTNALGLVLSLLPLGGSAGSF